MLDGAPSIGEARAMDVDGGRLTTGGGPEDSGTTAEAAEAEPDEPLTLYLVKRLELVVRSLMDDALRPRGLTTLQFTALSVLARQGRLSSAALARRSFVTPQSMNEMVLWLERHDLVERERDPRNRRVLLIRLTEHGRRTVAECTAIIQEFEDRVLDEMRPGERLIFRDCLRRGYSSLLPLVQGSDSSGTAAAGS